MRRFQDKGKVGSKQQKGCHHSGARPGYSVLLFKSCPPRLHCPLPSIRGPLLLPQTHIPNPVGCRRVFLGCARSTTVAGTLHIIRRLATKHPYTLLQNIAADDLRLRISRLGACRGDLILSTNNMELMGRQFKHCLPAYYALCGTYRT